MYCIRRAQHEVETPSRKQLGEGVMDVLVYAIAWAVLTVVAFAFIVVYLPPDVGTVCIFGWRILAAYLVVSIGLGYRWIRRGPGLI